MKRLATIPQWKTSAPPTSDGRPAMEYIGIDVHQRERQGCVVDEDGRR